MEALHGFVQTMWRVVSYHGVCMVQLVLISLQKLTDDGHCCRLDPHPSGGQGLKKLG